MRLNLTQTLLIAMQMFICGVKVHLLSLRGRGYDWNVVIDSGVGIL